MAVIMAGGEGIRLRSVLPGLPKPMAPLAGKPVMERIIRLLSRSGITDMYATLRYMPEAITEYFRDGKNFDVHLSYHIENEPMGTAGGVRACFDSRHNEDLLIISGDAACDFDLRKLMEYHYKHKSAVTMALFPSKEPLEYGLVLTDPQGRVRSFIEKPSWERVVTNFVNTGIYIVSPRALAMIPENQKFDFAKNLFPLLLEKGEEIRGLPMEGYWCDIGTPRAYFQCNLDALDGKLKLFDDCPAPSTQSSSNNPPSVNSRAFSSCTALPCQDRALLMRALSENLMEAGADFTQGLSLKTPNGGIRISPDPKNSALLIESDHPALCEEYSRLALSLIDNA